MFFLLSLPLLWCACCWAVALLTWALRLVAGWAGEEEFPRRVLRAPIDLPRRISYAVCRFRRRMGDTETRRISRAAAHELASALKKEGFAVLEQSVTNEGYVRVRTIVHEKREDEYREVFDRVYCQFAADISLERFCAATEPVDLLDEQWAKRYGRRDHARPAHTAPCKSCGRRQKVREVFGVQEVFRVFDESRKNVIIYDTPNGVRGLSVGHFCTACRKRQGLTVIEGITTTDTESEEDEG